MDDWGKIIFFLAALFIYAVYQVIKIRKEDKEEETAKNKKGAAPVFEAIKSVVIKPAIKNMTNDDPYDFEGSQDNRTVSDGNIRGKSDMTAKELWMAANESRNKMQAQARAERLKIDTYKPLYTIDNKEATGEIGECYNSQQNDTLDCVALQGNNENTEERSDKNKTRIIDDFDLKKAIIYSEILIPKF